MADLFSDQYPRPHGTTLEVASQKSPLKPRTVRPSHSTTSHAERFAECPLTVNPRPRETSR